MTSKTFSAGTVVDSAWLNDVNTSVYKAQSGGTGTTNRTNIQKWADLFINVKDYGAVGDGTTDDTSAIAAADAAACAGTLGLDGVTIVAEKAVFFPPGTYKVTSTLTYRGAPWFGSGTNTTLLKFYGSSGPLIDAVGTNSNRKMVSISNIALSGVSASGTAYGIKLGYNQRSFQALDKVRIDRFPGPAIYFTQPTWSMTFYDVYCSYNSNGVGSVGSAVTHDAAVAAESILALEWYNLQLENNGYTSSGLGGGLEFNTSVHDCKFFGGVWESNMGAAEARFTSCPRISIDELYLESEVAKVTDGVVFNNTTGSIDGFFGGELTMTGAAVRLKGTSNASIDIYSNIKWTYDVKLENTAIASMLGEVVLNFSVAAGAQLRRITPKRYQLTDAATIAVDASQGSSFYVTLAGNRTVGAPTNPSVGQLVTFTIIQDGTGGRTLTWNAVFKVSWSDTGNTASKKSSLQFQYDGTNWNQISAQSPYV